MSGTDLQPQRRPVFVHDSSLASGPPPGSAVTTRGPGRDSGRNHGLDRRDEVSGPCRADEPARAEGPHRAAAGEEAHVHSRWQRRGCRAVSGLGYNGNRTLDPEVPMSPSPRSPKPSPGKSVEAAAPAGSAPARRRRDEAGGELRNRVRGPGPQGRRRPDPSLGNDRRGCQGREPSSRRPRAAQTRVRKLNADWKNLPPKRRAQVLAGVLGAIATAIAVPLVVRKIRRSRASEPAGAAEE